MKSNTVQLFQTAGVTYSWQPVAEFSRFELAVFYRGEYDKSLSPQIIYVDGARIKLERILAAWNESKNFKYEVKP